MSSDPPGQWPAAAADLEALQAALAQEAGHVGPWTAPPMFLAAGCFVAYARGEAGPGHPGDRAWAAAVLWPAPAVARRTAESVLRHSVAAGGPRQAGDVVEQAVVAARVPAAYAAGLLALREGPILEQAVAALTRPPDVLLVDATGGDHPRGAGLALHLGAVMGLPSVGVTHRPLVAAGLPPGPRRGATSPLMLGGREVGRWVRTRTGARPVAAHAAWRTDPPTAADVVLTASTPAARTPVPLQEARRVAREARALAGAG
jgi:deoxyribonuclease V